MEICKFVRKYNGFFIKRGDKYKDRTVRHKNMLMLPTSRITLHSNSTYVMAVKIYNKIPDSLKDEISDKKFISKIKDILVDKAYYSLNEYMNDKLFLV